MMPQNSWWYGAAAETFGAYMMAMKMINGAHTRKGKVKSFTSNCGGLPSAAANNPLPYTFSWNLTGAIRAGPNPKKYKRKGDIIHVDGNKQPR